MESKKNALLFVIILAILSAIAVLIYLFGGNIFGKAVKGGSKNSPVITETIATTTIATSTTKEIGTTTAEEMATTTVPENKKSFWSFLNIFRLNLNIISPTNQIQLPPPTPPPVKKPPQTTNEISSELNNISKNVQTIQEQIDMLERAKVLSPLNGKLILDRVYSYSLDPNAEYIIMRSASTLGGTEKITITGLTLYSPVTGQKVLIPKGVYLFYNNQQNIEQLITVGAGEQITISTGHSPINYSFRINKCSPYLAQFKTFNPSLSTYICPALRNEKLPLAPNALNDACLDYINYFPSCRVHVDSGNNLTDPFYKQSPECQKFIINNTGYNNCSLNHKNDADFYKKEWRVYLGQSAKLWKTSRETIQLLDTDGKLISQIKLN